MIGKVNTVGFDYERVSNNMYPFNPFNLFNPFNPRGTAAAVSEDPSASSLLRQTADAVRRRLAAGRGGVVESGP